MAEMTDQRLDALLRATLRTEVASLPLTVTPEDVLGRAARHRRRDWRGLRLLGLAALLAVGAGLVIAGSQRTRPEPTVVSTVEETGPMVVPRAFHTSTLLEDGRVLLTGGISAAGDLASAELYDLGTNTFAATGDMTVARTNHTATLLEDGRVLIVGGDSAELFDPATGLFARTGDPVRARYGHAAIRTQDGRVLVIGGAAPSSDPLTPPVPDVETFDPAIGAFTASNVESAELHRMWPSLVLLADGQILIVGGKDVDHEYPVWRTEVARFDPVSETVRSLGLVSAGPLPSTGPRDVGGATRLPDGRVLVLAADDLGSWAISVIDPTVRSYRASSFVAAIPGHYHSRPTPPPVLLADGSALVFIDVDPDPSDATASGGDREATRSMLEAFIVDPDSGTLRELGSVPEIERVEVTPLRDGGALVTGSFRPDGSDVIEVAHRIR